MVSEARCERAQRSFATHVREANGRQLRQRQRRSGAAEHNKMSDSTLAAAIKNILLPQLQRSLRFVQINCECLRSEYIVSTRARIVVHE